MHIVRFENLRMAALIDRYRLLVSAGLFLIHFHDVIVQHVQLQRESILCMTIFLP